MHYYKRNIGDYSKKAGRLSILQHGVYNLLIDACYDREKFPTTEEAIDWVWASTKEEEEAVFFVLKKFFTQNEEGFWMQNRIQEEIDLYHKKAQTNKRIANEREAKRKGKNTNRERTVNEAPPNQEPITNNHKPYKNLTRPNIVDIQTQKHNIPESSHNNPPPVKDNCPHQEIVNLYHEHLPMMTRVRDWSERRRKKLRARWRAKAERQNLEFWSSFFKYIAKSDFLCGRKTEWMADLEWIVGEKNFQKIQEGFYENREATV